jgi:hypothetical protein
LEEKSSVNYKISLAKEEFLKLGQENLMNMNFSIKQEKNKEEEINKIIKTLNTDLTLEKNKC